MFFFWKMYMELMDRPKAYTPQFTRCRLGTYQTWKAWINRIKLGSTFRGWRRRRFTTIHDFSDKSLIPSVYPVPSWNNEQNKMKLPLSNEYPNCDHHFDKWCTEKSADDKIRCKVIKIAQVAVCCVYAIVS